MAPEELHPSLTPARLNFVVNVVARARNGAVDLHAPDSGETLWSLGCRALERVIYAISDAVRLTDGWLTVIDGSRHFRFAIDGIPVGVYRGKPRKPKASTLKARHPELRAVQQSFPGMARVQRLRLRFAVETDDDGSVSEISLVQLDDGGQAVEVWPLWSRTARLPGAGSPPSASAGAETVTPMRSAAKKLPRAQVRRRTRKGKDETGSGPVDA